MTYKLAEQLYKAGFPNIKCSEESPNPGYSYPTLSELIEACGGKFIELRKQTTNWLVLGRTDDETCDKGVTHNAGPANALGKTPEEAVARLWLALQDN